MAGRVPTQLTATTVGRPAGQTRIRRASLALGGAALVIGATAIAFGLPRGDERVPDKSAAEVLESIRATCLGRYRDAFTKIAVELRRERTATTVTVLLIDTASGRLRVSDDGSHSLLLSDRALQWTSSKSVRALDSEATRRLERLRDEVCAALLRPLVEAIDSSAKWTDAQTIEFQSKANTTWLLRTDQDGLPRSLESTTAHLEFVQFSNSRPRLPRIVKLTNLGDRHLRIIGDQVQLDDGNFEPPSATERPPVEIELSKADRPTVPVFRDDNHAHWLCIADPGTWATRIQACFDLGSKLGSAGQKNGGDPLLFEDDAGKWLAIPFVAQVPNAPDSGYQPADGERILPAEEGGIVVVVLAPRADTFDARIQAGRTLLDTHLAHHERKATGPLRIIINLVYEEGLSEASPTELSMDVRLELPIAR